MIYITSDHGGFELKKYIVENIPELTDLGPSEFDPEDDYPDFVPPLVDKVLEDKENMGIVICRNGVGVSMAANKFKGIRAALSFNIKHAESSRKDDNSNVLALPSDYISHEEAIEIVKTWLNAPFSNKERHVRRVAKVNNMI
ncbi:MAG: RpiB/LacA/LacB family sugar-phosphate isomerase [Patescibacteria group bacterium]|nr:RpiB/LacA/LacB family sugar-phosphate isomerase [Patescibacteria group bacterium]